MILHKSTSTSSRHYRLLPCFIFFLTFQYQCQLITSFSGSINTIIGSPSSSSVQPSKSSLFSSSKINNNNNNGNRCYRSRRFTTTSLCNSKDKNAATSSSTNDYCLSDKQLDFVMGYLNKHHVDLLIDFVKAFSNIGAKEAQMNVMSGGSYKIVNAKIINIINNQSIELEAYIEVRGKQAQSVETVLIDLDANPIKERRRKLNPGTSPFPRDDSDSDVVQPIDDILRRLIRLCWIVKQPKVTGKLIQLGIQLGESENKIGKLPDNMFLNQVPHNRYVRQYFYDTAAQAALDACVLCSQHKISNRMKITAMFPEMNPSMDSYRIGTLLEMVRTITIKLAEQNLRIRVCVQDSMGVGIFTGLPKQLNGVAKLLQLMDWQSEEGEQNEGMVGNYVNFGAIGSNHVMNKQTKTILQDIEEEQEVITDNGETKTITVTKKVERTIDIEQDDVFIIICPQSMVGVESSIMGLLEEMVDAVGDRPIILINPDLTDKVSSQGQQSVRGRQQRIDFANSFKPIYHFQNIYVSGTSYFPILGSITKFHPQQLWVAHQRRDYIAENNNNEEVYIPILASEEMPSGEEILNSFDS